MISSIRISFSLRAVMFAVITAAICYGEGQSVVGITGVAGGSDNQRLVSLRRPNPKSAERSVVVFVGDTVIPQLVDGAGWKTTITVHNLESGSVHFRVLFFSDNGLDMILPVVGQGMVRGMEIELRSAGTYTFETAGDFSGFSQGWAGILKDHSEDAVGGFAVFRQRVPGRPDFEAVVPVVNQFDSRFVLLFDNTSTFVTAMAIANPSTSAVVVPAIIRNEAGAIIDRQSISLAAFAHTAGSIPLTWPMTAGRRGSIEFNASGFGVGVLGIRFNTNGGAFTSFHVLSNIRWLVP